MRDVIFDKGAEAARPTRPARITRSGACTWHRHRRFSMGCTSAGSSIRSIPRSCLLTSASSSTATGAGPRRPAARSKAAPGRRRQDRGVPRLVRPADVELVTLWMLSTDNLDPAGGRVDPLLGIIEDLVGRPRRQRALARAPGGHARPAARRHASRLKEAEEQPRRHRRDDRQHRRRLRRPPGDRRRGPLPAARARRAGHEIEELAEIVDVEHISEHLYTRGQPDPDLVIRT